MAYLLQHLLSESARNYPDWEAVVFGDERLTYRELDQLADRLAWMLTQHGVERGDRIGIYMNKSLSSIVSIFGILKAGCVYVPLDPNAPLARPAHIVQDCGIRCLLTSPTKREEVAGVVAKTGPFDLLVWCDTSIDAEPTDRLAHQTVSIPIASAGGPESSPSVETIDTDLAYILYTSGSTGQPKGVTLSHLNALTFVNWACEELGIHREDRLSNHAPLHFDLSIFDIFVAAKAGATVVIVPETLSVFPSQLAEFIATNRISVWYSVPSILTLLTLYGELSRHDLSLLRLILFAGEVFPMKYLRALMEVIPQASYYNFYGPTETNVCTYYHVDQIPAEGAAPVPIGKACKNTEVCALDADGHQVTRPGQEGELCVRGSTVMRGYWGRPKETAAATLPSPLGPHLTDRVYRTGDLVTLDDRGDYLFLGRKDHMIKSRGYRIELGEIEAALYKHAAVKEAVVVPVPDELVNNRIYAYVVPRDGTQVSPEEIRRHCADWLPHYMVPEVVELQTSLPKTSTGKIDRQYMAGKARQIAPV
jgi:amino acid adenylation domain-containing protein